MHRPGFAMLASIACLVMAAASAAPPLSAHERVADFDALWNAIDSSYAYLDAGRREWRRLRLPARRAAERARTRDEFISVLEGAIEYLHDDGVSLSERSPASPRVLPFESDIWASWRNGAATVEAVRVFSDADAAGLRPGDVVTRVDGVAIDRAVRERLRGAARTPAAMDWALRRVLAGPRAGEQRIEIEEGHPDRVIVIERNGPLARAAAPVVARRMGDARDIGYLRIRAGDERLAEHFDQAFRHLVDTRALIIDMRDSGGAGSRAATLAILGRFVAKATPWQLREARGKSRIADLVEPRGTKPYAGPLVVLVDRWTAGEDEALAEGLRSVAGARIVGTRTAGFAGEPRELQLPHGDIVLRFPAEKTFRVTGEARGPVRPDVEVDLAAPKGGPGDPILYQALKLLEPCPGSACRSERDSPPPARGSPRR